MVVRAFIGACSDARGKDAPNRDALTANRAKEGRRLTLDESTQFALYNTALDDHSSQEHAPGAGECPLSKRARVLGANGGTGRCLSFRRTPRRSSTCTIRNAWRDGDNMIAYPESVVPATLTTELSRRPACDEQLAKQDVGMSQHDAQGRWHVATRCAGTGVTDYANDTPP